MNGSGGGNGNQQHGSPPSESGLGPSNGNSFPSFSTSSWPSTTFQTSITSSSPSQTNAINYSRTSASGLGTSEPSADNSSSGAGVIVAIIILILVFLSILLGIYLYRRNHQERQHQHSIGAIPSPRNPLFPFLHRKMTSTSTLPTNNEPPYLSQTQLSFLDTKPLPPNPEDQPAFRVSIPAPRRAYNRTSFRTERSVSIYSDTNLYFIPSKEVGLETRLPSRGGELLMRQGPELDNYNPFKTPFPSPAKLPPESPKYMIGEGKWRRLYRGKLRPGMGVQRLLTRNDEVGEMEEVRGREL